MGKDKGMNLKKEPRSFTFRVDESSDVPLWVQLRQRIIYLINSGFYRPGDKLPTVRGLASEISINYNTVNKAYLSLVSDGYLESTRGRGVFVRDFDAEVGGEYAQEVRGIVDDCIAACRELGLSLEDVQQCVARRIDQLRKAEGVSDAAGAGGSARRGRIVHVQVDGEAKMAEGR